MAEQYNPLVVILQILALPLQIVMQLLQNLPPPPMLLLPPGSTLSQSPSPKATYSNKEEWEIVRDSEGMISKVVIHREATRNE